MVIVKSCVQFSLVKRSPNEFGRFQRFNLFSANKIHPSFTTMSVAFDTEKGMKRLKYTFSITKLKNDTIYIYFCCSIKQINNSGGGCYSLYTSGIDDLRIRALPRALQTLKVYFNTNGNTINTVNI